MMDMSLALALALLNLVICTGIGYTCACRLNLMEGARTRASFRAKYSSLLVGATASGFSPLFFGEWPGFGQVMLSAAFLFMMAAGSRAWRDGPPEYAQASAEVAR
jgi:hypothetical protein